MPFATFVVAGDCTAPLKSTKPVHYVIVNDVVLLSFLFACSSTKTALSTTCAADESKRGLATKLSSSFRKQENPRQWVSKNGCYLFFLLSFFQLKPTVYIVAARLDIILWRGVIIQSHMKALNRRGLMNHGSTLSFPNKHGSLERPLRRTDGFVGPFRGFHTRSQTEETATGHKKTPIQKAYSPP